MADQAGSQQILLLYPEDITWLAGLFTANFCWQLKACPMEKFLITQIYRKNIPLVLLKYALSLATREELQVFSVYLPSCPIFLFF